ncbi:MAG: hypothetical protein Q9167_005756 [Letrouitia subvulpina]
MNNPGLDEPIQKESEGLEQDRKDDEDIEKEDEQTFLNPRLIGVNAVSLAFALAANMALLLNMARRVSFAVAQPITIIGWYIASILLIALVVAATYGLKIPGQNQALTQAFYYAIIAAGIYFIISTLMVATVYGAYAGHYPKEFTLTMSQRTLMLQTISFMFYMLAGAAVYSKVEGWKFLDAVYFTNYTLLTVGIGDYAPLTHTGRALLFPYAVGGIVTLGLVVGSIRTLVLERGKQKITRRLVEKRREQVVRRMTKRGEDDKLKPIESQQEAKAVGMTEQERRKMEFDLMRQIQNHADQREKWNALLLSGSAWLVLWLVGAAVFWKAEHGQEWSYFGALYFAYTSLLTIGYGDFKPFSNAGKPAFVFWSLLAVPALTIVISNMGDTVVKGVRDLTDYLGEFTLLPGESPTKQRIKQIASIAGRAKNFGKGNGGSTLSYHRPNPVGEEALDTTKQERAKPDAAVDDVVGFLQEEELEAFFEAKGRGDAMIEDAHAYHYSLVKEFRNVLGHLSETPPRRYKYEEWAWYLKLMGEDEANNASHRKPPVKIRKRKSDAPDTQQGSTDDTQYEARQWSWLGHRSPLMGEAGEAQWVLERLCVTLEKELKKQTERAIHQRQQAEEISSGRGSDRTLEGEGKARHGERFESK